MGCPSPTYTKRHNVKTVSQTLVASFDTLNNIRGHRGNIMSALDEGDQRLGSMSTFDSIYLSARSHLHDFEVSFV